MSTVLRLPSTLWPGLNAVWRDGSWHALVIAFLFGVLLNFAWLSTFVWPQWVSGYLVWTLWLSIGSGMIGSFFFVTFVERGRLSPAMVSEREKKLIDAQELYLQANYFEAERMLGKSNLTKEIDIEAELLRVSIYRRTGRIESALELIHKLNLLESSAVWSRELAAEKALCTRSKKETPPAQQ